MVFLVKRKTARYEFFSSPQKRHYLEKRKLKPNLVCFVWRGNHVFTWSHGNVKLLLKIWNVSCDTQLFFPCVAEIRFHIRLLSPVFFFSILELLFNLTFRNSNLSCNFAGVPSGGTVVTTCHHLTPAKRRWVTAISSVHPLSWTALSLRGSRAC